MADGARVGEVVDARLLVGGQQERARQQVVQDGVGVGDVNDMRVLRDLGNEMTGGEGRPRRACGGGG